VKKILQGFVPIGKPVAVCLLLYYCLGVIANNYPTNTAFGRELREPFDFYVKPLHLHKPYNMFYTYDPWHKFDLSVIAKTEHGLAKRFAPILPGLEELHGKGFQGKGKLRVRVSLQRMTKRRSSFLLKGYAQNLCDAIRERTQRNILEVTLEFKTERLRKLSEIKKDGVMGKTYNFSRGPYRCK
tara:strand:+ start:355 stop:906 length:552 start_codon:yes stop_codon:yes gene_type:complete